MERLHAALKLAGADAQERNAVTVVLVHVGLDLEDKAAELLAARLDQLTALRVLAGQRGGGQAQELLQERLHAEVRQSGAEEHGGQLAVLHGVEVKLLGSAVQQLDVLGQLFMVGSADQVVQAGVAQLGLDLLDHLDAVGAAIALKGQHAPGIAVIDALEVLAAADGPVHRVGLDAEDFFNVLHQLKRVAGLAVHLVDEGEDRDVAQRADLEQLDGLGLNALGGVNDHDGGIRRHQGAVGILTEVLVAGRVQNVDALALIVELQNRRGNGNTTLLFNVHPVGHRMLGALLALDRTRGLDGPTVEQELFGECGFTGVGVRDDRKCAPGFDFFAQ